MDKKAILVSAVAVIAAVLVVLSVFLFIFKDDEAPIKHNDVASPSKIKFGLTYVGETEFDLNAVREYYLSDGKYVDHNISDEYVMIYQAQNEEMQRLQNGAP